MSYQYILKSPKNVPAVEFISNLEKLLNADTEINSIIAEACGCECQTLLEDIEVREENLVITTKLAQK